MPMVVDNAEGAAAAATFDMPKRLWRKLFYAVAERRPGALEALYDLAAPKLFGLALWATGSRDDASDVVSEVFVRLAEQGTALDRVRDPRAWLLTVTRRLTVDLARQRRRRPTEALDGAELVTAVSPDPDRRLDAELASALLAALPPPQREVVFLHHFAELSFGAIGRVTGVPTFTAASRYRLAIRRLRKHLEARS